MKKAAIIGSGISGLSSAFILHQKYEIDVYEKNDYIGGHSNTVDIEVGDKILPVDTGFIVFNHKTYPNLTKLFHYLDVPCQKAPMSFGAAVDDGKIEYSSAGLISLFAQGKNIINPLFAKMIFDIRKFNKKSLKLLETEAGKHITLGEFVENLNLGSYFKNYYLYPMAGAIWSCPVNTILDYPAYTFLNFFKNHGLLSMIKHPQWYTVKGGSKEYVKKLIKPFKDRVHLKCPVISVERNNDGVLVEFEKDDKVRHKTYDIVIFACHGDEALNLIKNPSYQHKNILGKFLFQRNETYLHLDENLMAKNKRAWAAWNYLKNKYEKEDRISVTYWMNKLQSIKTKEQFFVTLNPIKEIDEKKVLQKITYHHPIFDFEAVKAQSEIENIQGHYGFYFCGAYHGHGFHEDGLNSAIKLCKKLGVEPLWE